MITDVNPTAAPPNAADLQSPDPKWDNFTEVKGELTQLIESWAEQIKNAQKNRDIRDVRVDNEKLRKSGKIESDETYIPIRMIDSNIKRTLPPLIAYSKQSRRAAVFKVVGDSAANTEYIEKEFTAAAHYDGWEVDLYKTYDGSSTHGWSSIEICFDVSMPGRFKFDYVANEELIFPQDTIDIQAQNFIMRSFKMTKHVLKGLVKTAGWSDEQVARILDAGKAGTQGTTRRSLYTVYKHFFKMDGVVYVTWWAEGCDDWIIKPAPFYNGIGTLTQQPVTDPLTGMPAVDPATGQPQTKPVVQPASEQEYPFEIFFWDITEKREITSNIGIVTRDEYKQEALSGITSSFVNGSYRAASLYVTQEDKPGALGKQSAVGQKLKQGVVMASGLKILTVPYPDASMLRAAQYLETQNLQENNQINFAAQNRQDSRKTAAEIEAAQSQNNLISSTNVTLLSTFLRNIYRRAFKIVVSQAQSNTGFKFCASDPSVIFLDYDIRAAGDTDVIERQERIEKMTQLLSIVAGTGAETQFRADLIRAALPDNGEVYAKLIIESSPERQMIQQLGGVIMAAAQNGGQITTPAPQLLQLAQQANAIVTGQSGAK